MHTVISAFADEAAAQRAAERLRSSGVRGVQLHPRAQPASNATAIRVDEYASGGVFSNLRALLDELFANPEPPDKAESYADVVRREGVGLSVEVADAAEAQRVETLLEAEGAMKVARIPGSDSAG
jgi:hypothetical protein